MEQLKFTMAVKEEGDKMKEYIWINESIKTW